MKAFPVNIKICDEVELQIFDKDHATSFYKTIHNKNEDEDYRKRYQTRFKTVSCVRDMLEDAIDDKLKKSGSPDYFIVCNGEIAGMFEFHPLTDEPSVEIGYWLFNEHRRKGVLSKIIPVMIDFTKEHFNKRHIMATTSIDNKASQALLEKMQFTKTGKILEFKSRKSDSVSKEFEYLYQLDD